MAKKIVKKEGKDLNGVIKDIRSRYGEESIMMLKDKPRVDVEAISTGSMGIDTAIGVGGLPRGRIIEVYGPESSGKTTLALHVIAEAQKKGDNCAFIDAEHAMDPVYAERLGVQIDKLMIAQPSNGEEALSIVDSLIQSNSVGVIVVDSVAALTPKAIVEGEVGEVKIGALARLMSQSLSKLTGSISKTKTIVLFINQTRMNIAAMSSWGAPPETTAGGKALKFYASVRLEVKRIAQIKKADAVIGGQMRVKVIKNKVAPPFKIAEVDIIFNEGISKETELLSYAEKYKVIDKSGSWYSWGDTKLGQGLDGARVYLKENPEVFSAIKTEVLNKMKSEE